MVIQADLSLANFETEIKIYYSDIEELSALNII